MERSEKFGIIVHILNFIIFLYFSIKLIQAGFLDIIDTIIASVGLLSSLIVSIVGAVEKLKE